MRHGVCVFLALLLAATSANGGEPASDPLTLNEAVGLTIERNPRIAAMREAHLAVTGRRLEAGAWPNPELSFQAEIVRFSDGPGSTTTVRATDGTLIERSASEVSNSGFGESELTLGISQAIELGGKRARRIALADQSIQVALWDYEVARANAIASTRQAFIDVLAAQENQALRQRLARLAEEAANAIRVRVESGKDSPMLRDRSEIEHAQARIELAAAERALEAARYALSARWDDREPRFGSARGDLYAMDALPARESFQAALERSPDIARWSAEVARREAAVALERSKRAPDLAVNLGWRAAALADAGERNFDAGGALSSTSSTRPDDRWDHSLVVGVSVPLPLFRRNRGGIAEAEHLAAQAAQERRAGHADAWARASVVHAGLDATRAEIAVLRETVMPAAERTYAAAQAGFEGGKFTYLDVLDAQRTLFRVQGQYLEAYAVYQRGIAELERLLGTSSPTSMEGVSK